jgi:rhodanese-related sulfurtransferase
MLSIRFVFPLLLTATICACNIDAQEKISLSPKDFATGITNTAIQVLDVRTMAEYQSGHLKNSFLADWTNQSEFKERVAHLDKTKPVYTYCLSGVRSRQAADWLQKNGFTTVFNLDGGIVAWKKADMPVEGGQQVAKQITMEQYLAGIPADKTVLVDIGAVWCPPCKKMEPILDSLATSKDLHFTLLKINGGDQTQLVKQLNIDGFPTLIIYKNGKEVWRHQGVIDSKALTVQLQ